MKRYRVKLSGDGWGKTINVYAENATEMLWYVERKYNVGNGVSCTCNLAAAEEVEGCYRSSEELIADAF